MLPDRVSSSGPLTYESDALPIALRGPASKTYISFSNDLILCYSWNCVQTKLHMAPLAYQCLFTERNN